MVVVIKYFTILGCYSICHARSEQNAFSSQINRFDSYDMAYRFCIENKCKVMKRGEYNGLCCAIEFNNKSN